ncbi:hypothetical protein ACFB49_46830 [Sphingomonas sp. DBB INV C78]|uniref:hypothetical protein n=1 Tax=Sphingomonas sp. DBB INV C78 TaxID=3349434 RepID=UPI0036D3BD36
MAAKPHSVPDGAWNTRYAHYLSLTQRLEQSPPEEHDALERAIAATQDDLLDTPAPSFTAVKQKLEMLWQAELHGLDQASEERRLVLEDLSGLIHAQSELLGAA